MIGWKQFDDLSLLQQVRDDSFVRPQVIFKHSTRCSVSSGALSRVNQHETPEGADFYFLDVIQHRLVSGEVAVHFDVRHESPQLLVIWQGNTAYHESHRRISFDLLLQQLAALQSS